MKPLQLIGFSIFASALILGLPRKPVTSAPIEDARAPLPQLSITESLPETQAQPLEELARIEPPKPVYTAPASSGGDCASWMAEAGIPLTNATQTLILKESGCRPNAINPSSGACGIPQSLPCSKMGCSLDNAGAVCQLRWMDGYVKARYGSWDNALATWYSRGGSPSGCWY